MKTEVHEIDVNKAKDFLAKNTPFERGAVDTNRPVIKRKINQYAVDMLKKRWRLTHQGIAFDKNGKLKDGQHRLMAIIQAAEEGAIDGEEVLKPNPRIKVPMPVTFGIDTDTFDFIDTGLNRSAAQILAMSGYHNSTNLGAAARLLILYTNHEYRVWNQVKVTNHQILEVVRNSGISEYLDEVSPMKHIGFLIPAMSVGYYVAEHAWKDGPHQDFLHALRTGENMRADDPRLVLRNYVIRSKGQPHARRDAAVHLALYIIAWNDFSQGKKRQALTWRPATNNFPTPIEK